MGGLLGMLGLDPDELKRLAVWAKGRRIPGWDENVWRLDDYGNRICYFNYGDRNSEWGWELDHYPTAKSLGGSDDISNLRPLHCRKNASLGGILGGMF